MLVKNWFQRYAYAGCLPSDTESERLNKAILVSIPTGISLLAIFWVSGYLWLDRPLPAAIPGGYAVFSLLSVLLFFKTKHYGFFRFSQLLLILLLPFLLQWSLGGFNNASAVMIWGVFSPIGALMFHGARQSVPWVAAFLALTVLSGLLDNQLSATVAPLPDAVVSVFYVMNLGCASLLLFIVVNYFVTQNKEIIAALSAEQIKTARALSEEAAQRAAAEQAKAVIEAQSKKLIEMDRVKSRFFDNISHEFRTPLTLIIGPLEDCLTSGAKPPKSQLEIMLRNCRRLLRLINQLLDISKLEAGGMKLSLSRGNLTQFLRGIVRTFVPFAESKGIDLNLSAEAPDVDYDFDVEKLEKVFFNLLSNASKFTPPGGKVLVALSVEADEHGEELLHITVKDTGPGIPKNEIAHVFDRFHQVDGSSTREHEGTGIGLALVKDLVSLHGGKIAVKSDPGFGAEFIVTLPAGVEQHDAALGAEGHREETALDASPFESYRAQSEATLLKQDLDAEGRDVALMKSPAGGARANSQTVLVIDDNTDIRAYLHDILSTHYDVTQAADGEEGLRVMQEILPDLVVCDVMMPKLDGYDVCRRVKTDSRLNHIPLILLTAKATAEMKIEGLEAGADDYIAKPFNAKELLARVGNLITMRRQESELKVLNEHLEEQIKQQLGAILNGKRLTRYFSKKILDRILSNDDAQTLSSERRKITVFFSDLCNFTDLVDTAQPEEVGRILNEYLAEMTLLIAREGATLVQVIGDGIMVFFGAPDPMDSQDQANNALKMALGMQSRMRQLSKKWLDEGLDLNVNLRIGIHQDYLTVGNFGCDEFMEYTAVGRGINLASRLESSCTPGKIKVSYPIYALTKDQFPYDELNEEQFKGVVRAMKVCELDPDRVIAWRS